VKKKNCIKATNNQLIVHTCKSNTW